MNAKRYIAALLLMGAAPVLSAQTVDPVYAGTYSLTDLGSVSGLPTPYGGLIFKAGDPDTILIGGTANTSSGLFYSVPVTRGVGGHIVSLGAATALGFGVNNDGGIAYGPGGVLFYSEYSINNVGQVKPGSSSDDKTVALGPLGIAASTGALNFVPPGYNGAGQFKISSWSGGQFYTVSLATDGSGTYDLTGATLEVTLAGGPEGFIYVPLGSALFPAQSMLVAEYSAGNVASYTIDANGNPVLASRQNFITGLSGAEGAAIDPVTGDFFFSTFGGSNRVIQVTGFAVPTAAPTIAKSFGGASMPINGVTSLTFTVTNPNAATSLTGVGFTDALPTGLAVASPNGLAGSCGGGTITATAGTNVVSLSGATLAASAQCLFSVNVTGSTAGTKNNTTGNITSTEGGTGSTASASVAVVAPPTLSKAFGAATIPLSGTTTLTLTVANPAANTVALAGVAFTDSLPAGLLVATPNGLANTCGGTPVATAGSGTVSLSGATVAIGGTCTVSVNVTGATPGTKNNTTGPISSTNGGTGATSNTASVTVTTALTIAKSFSAASIARNSTTSLTFTITNPNASGTTGVAFTDTLPAGLAVATPNGLTGSCGAGTITATAGAGAVSLTGGTVAGSGTCVFSVNVTGTTAGVKNNSVTVSSTEGGTGNQSNASLTVIAPPAISKVFGAASIALNGTTSLSFTVQNNNGTVGLSGIGFTDTLPAGLVIATPNGSTGSCGGGTISATAGTQSASLTGATLAAGASCVFAVNVVGTGAGQANNTTGLVTSVEGGSGGTASASVTVIGATPTPPASIPTLQDWALLTLSLLLVLGAAGVALQRRRRAQR